MKEQTYDQWLGYFKHKNEIESDKLNKRLDRRRAKQNKGIVSGVTQMMWIITTSEREAAIALAEQQRKKAFIVAYLISSTNKSGAIKEYKEFAKTNPIN